MTREYFQCLGSSFLNVKEAVEHAKQSLMMEDETHVVIWNTVGVVIALLTDDANGITLHKLKTFPEGVEV